ncbi:MAG: hypothetical protein ACOC05_04465 [Oceanicaulis sp.]
MHHRRHAPHGRLGRRHRRRAIFDERAAPIADELAGYGAGSDQIEVLYDPAFDYGSDAVELQVVPAEAWTS